MKKEEIIRTGLFADYSAAATLRKSFLTIKPKGIAAQRQGKNIPPSSGVTEKERGGEKIELTRT
ncbi:MAG: hypothetical protein D3914_02825 [Candidatus Electrothrix sp. LOE2]|nr:hypothetical protein [Candidatus Electrothrix sp. LOE2]